MGRSPGSNYLLEENHFKVMLCYFIEVAFINISEVFIKKTTGAKRRLARLGGEMADGISTFAATTINNMFTLLEELALGKQEIGKTLFKVGQWQLRRPPALVLWKQSRVSGQSLGDTALSRYLSGLSPDKSTLPPS